MCALTCRQVDELDEWCLNTTQTFMTTVKCWIFNGR